MHSLKRVSGFFFYLLGGSFFVAYMLQYNEVTPWASWWLRVGDLPLALSGVLYAGTSLYSSVKPKDRESFSLFVMIGIPLLAVFSTVMLLNFWPVLS